MLAGEVLAVGDRHRQALMLTDREFAATMIVALSTLGLTRRQLLEIIDQLPNTAESAAVTGSLIVHAAVEVPSIIKVHEAKRERETDESPDDIH